MEKIPLDDILLPEPIMVKTKSKEWKEKLSIRYNITKNPYTTVIDRWNKITKRYEPIDRAEYDMSMAPCRLITRCYVVTASTPVFGEKITDPTGVHCVDVLHMVYRCYNIVLTSAEREYYKDVMETDEFRRWFKYRCQQAENPEEERRLGPKRVDLLQGNVFYQGVKYLGNDTWEVQMYRNVDNSLYFVVSVTSSWTKDDGVLTKTLRNERLVFDDDIHYVPFSFALLIHSVTIISKHTPSFTPVQVT